MSGSLIIGVGIDTARFGHRVAFLRGDRQPAADSLTVTEDQQGYQRLRQRLEWVKKEYPTAQFRIHIDAAGQYATNLELFLRTLSWPVTISVGEPKRNKDYHKALFPKRSSDDTESIAMARFALAEQPAPKRDIPKGFYVLSEIASRLQAQIKDTTRAINRLHNLMARVFPELATIVNDFNVDWLLALLQKYPTAARIAAARSASLKKFSYARGDVMEKIHDAARSSVGTLQGELAESLIKECLAHLQNCRTTEETLETLLIKAYRELPKTGHEHIQSIPGIGIMTAAILVSKMVTIDRFDSPEKLVGYFGIFPEENSSGVDRQGRPIPLGTQTMSQKGADIVRRYLWNAAKSASIHNPAVHALNARLRAKGTRGDVAVGHCMRKLLHQVFGVWATNQPFDVARSRPYRPEGTGSTILPAPPKEEMVAGHNREPSPQNQVVTATTSTISPSIVKNKSTDVASLSIDYLYVREQITMQQLLAHDGHFSKLHAEGKEHRGPCPFHGSKNPTSRTFSVDLTKNVFCCHNAKCGKKGNVLDYWQAYCNQPLYESTLNLVDTFNLQLHRNR